MKRRDLSKYELVVMGFLLDRPMHGYHINRQVKSHRMDSWARISPPMIYKTLGNLELEGMVKARRERKGLMPERRVYRLTPRGSEWLGKLVEKSLLDKNLTHDLCNLGYFFLFALSKDRALECLKQKKILLDKTLSSLRKRVDECRGKIPANRFHVLEKDYDWLWTELHHLNKMITGVERCSDWRQNVFVDGDQPSNDAPEDKGESPSRRAGARVA